MIRPVRGSAALALLSVTLLVSTACSEAPTRSSTPGSTPRSASTQQHQRSSAAPGSPSSSPGTAARHPLSSFARKICDRKLQADLTGTLAYQTPVPKSAVRTEHVYRCTYRLPVGQLILSVNKSPDLESARGYFETLRRHLGPTRPVRGFAALGLPAFQTTDGTTVFLNKQETLQADATRLPRQVGKYHQLRSDLSYLIASRVVWPDT